MAHKNPKAKKNLTRADRNIAWIEEWCRIPEGKRGLLGNKVVLREWQRAELRKIYDNPHGTRQAIISFPRKNGKTALISFLLLLHLVGPEAVPNSQLYSSAISRDQAATVFKLAAKVVRLNPLLADVVNIRDTAKELVCSDLGTYYAALSAEKSTAHGKSPIFAIHDELGQVRGPVSELYDAVETGMGAHDAPLSIIISTQAPTDNDLLSRLIDDGLNARDPHTVVSVYSAPLDADPFSEDTLRACNPAWGDFLNSDEVLRTMRAAQAMPSSEPAYRNLHLNQRIEQYSPFVSKTLWLSCAAPTRPFGDAPVYGGLDLSEVNDLTAKILGACLDDVWNVQATFWLPETGLMERSRADRVPYDQWVREGFIETAPGKSVDYKFVAQSLWEDFGRYNIQKIGFDRWNWRHFRPWLLAAGFTEEQLDAHFVEVGQGFQSMSPALRDLESVLLNGKLAHGGHPVLTMCAANAVVQTDPAGNRKLNKARSRGRIDGMAALADMFAAAPAQVDAEPEYVTEGVSII